MLLDKINKLKEQLNAQLDKPCVDPKAILETSKKLDKLIVKYYKEKGNKGCG